MTREGKANDKLELEIRGIQVVDNISLFMTESKNEKHVFQVEYDNRKIVELINNIVDFGLLAYLIRDTQNLYGCL